MVDEHGQVVGVDAAHFRRLAAEVFGMVDDVLVDGHGTGDQHAQRLAAAPAGAADALPGRGDRARVGGQHHGVERADIDAQFQGIGRDHGLDLAVAQPFFDLAAHLGQIAAAVAAHRVPVLDGLFEIVLQVLDQDLGDQARIGKSDHLQSGFEQDAGDLAGHGDVGAADAQLAVDHRRVEKNQEFFAARRARSGRSATTSSSISFSASSAGLAMVAELMINTGRVP